MFVGLIAKERGFVLHETPIRLWRNLHTRILEFARYRILGVRLLFVLSIVILPCASHAQTDDRAALNERVNFLERQIRYLSDRVNSVSNQPSRATRGNSGSAGTAGVEATTRLSVRLSELENDIRSVTGRVEELSFQVRDLNNRVEQMSADLEYRTSQTTPGQQAAPTNSSEQGGGSAGAPANEPDGSQPAAQYGAGPRQLGAFSQTNPTHEQVQPEGPGVAEDVTQTSARQEYAYAFNLMRAKKYGEAEQAFQKFLEQNPDGPLTQNAHYWLGETYYAQGEFTRSATTFLEGYEYDKKGAKAPDTLLKLGMSLGRLGKKREACATFNELESAFPNVPTSTKTAANREKQRFECS